MMANHQCHGDFFTAAGELWYRCLWDGTIVPDTAAPMTACPNCSRPLNGVFWGVFLAALETRTMTVIEVKHPHLGWIQLKREPAST